MKPNLSSVAGYPGFDGERLLALSNLMRKKPREVEFQLQGHSMGSALPDGSRIRVRLGHAGGFSPGRVLAYVAKDRILVHRLVRSVKCGCRQYLIMRGDATVCCDLPVPVSSVLGVVIEFSRAGPWQPVGPPVKRWFGFRGLAVAIAGVVGVLLRVSPSCSVWTAKRIIAIQGVFGRASGLLSRRTVVRSRARASL